MEKKYYVIHQWGLADPPAGWDITETELKRRLCEIIGWPMDELGTLQSEIDTLLHGEKEQPWGFTEATYATGTNDSPEPIILSRAEPVSADKPSPTPTRKEWEEWAWRTAIEVWPVNTNLENRILLKDALLAMPGVPK